MLKRVRVPVPLLDEEILGDADAEAQGSSPSPKLVLLVLHFTLVLNIDPKP